MKPGIAASVPVPKGAKEGAYVLRASAGPFDRTLDILEHPDIAPSYFLKPAEAKIEIVDVVVPENLTIVADPRRPTTPGPPR